MIYMELNELITSIFQVCILPLLGILTTFFVKWVQNKSLEIQNNVDNETLEKYLAMVTQTISDCVIATNQTYVESLKAQGAFDAEAQKIAFQMTSDAVMQILSEDAKEYLEQSIGDLQAYIAKKIEAEVNINKLDKAV